MLRLAGGQVESLLDELDFPRLAGHSGYAAIVDGDGLRVA